MKTRTESKRVPVEIEVPMTRETMPAPPETKPSAPPRAWEDFSPDEQAAALKRYVAGGNEEFPFAAPSACKGIVREYLIAKGHRDVPEVVG